MSYRTGVATDMGDLVNKIAQFMVDFCGFTIVSQQTGVPTSPTRWWVKLAHISGKSILLSIDWGSTMYVYAGDGAIADPVGQSIPVGVYAQDFVYVTENVTPNVSMTHHLFGGDGYFSFVVQTVSSGLTAHVGVAYGQLQKSCTFTGGSFLASGTYNGFIQGNIDGLVGGWSTNSKLFRDSRYREIGYFAPIPVNNVTPFLPVTVEWYHTATQKFSTIGVIPHIKLFGWKGQYANGATVTIGGVDYVVFELPAYATQYAGYGFAK